MVISKIAIILLTTQDHEEDAEHLANTLNKFWKEITLTWKGGGGGVGSYLLSGLSKARTSPQLTFSY